MRQSRVRLRLPISPSSSPHHSARARARPSCPSLFPAALIGKGYGPARSITTALDTHPTYPNARLTSTRPWSILRAIKREYEALLNDLDEAAAAGTHALTQLADCSRLLAQGCRELPRRGEGSDPWQGRWLITGKSNILLKRLFFTISPYNPNILPYLFR